MFYIYLLLITFRLEISPKKDIFTPDANKQLEVPESRHLADMVVYLGPEPQELLDRSEYGNNFFKNSGNALADYSPYFVASHR